MITIGYNTDKELELMKYEDFIFPAGEIGLKLDYRNYRIKNSNEIQILARIINSNELIKLAMIKNAILNFVYDPKNIKIKLIMPYVPYGRQDRVCVKGEAFSLKVLTDYINFLNFDKVTIYDPHSDVTSALLNNVKIIDQLEIIKNFRSFSNQVFNGGVFVSPDAGSNKKTSKIAGFFEHSDFIRADKLRNLATGEIKETIVYTNDLEGRDVFICDDICDGGRTFIELAKTLKTKNCGKVYLFVTHGIFSKGVDVLLDNGIDRIFTTNSFDSKLKTDENLEVLNIPFFN
jgi:ribose-phosphate pyrophosphokinase